MLVINSKFWSQWQISTPNRFSETIYPKLGNLLHQGWNVYRPGFSFTNDL